MSDSKFIPPLSATPWHIEEVGQVDSYGQPCAIYEIRNDGGDLIADGVFERDARLMAAAPALLAACETREADLARRCAGDNPCCAGCRELTELRELITKAKEPMR